MAADQVTVIDVYGTDANKIQSDIRSGINSNNLSGIESVDLERIGSNRMVATVAHTTS